MTYSSVRGQTPEYHQADNVVDLPQEAALVRELRRLQKFLEQEQERERFPHAVDFQSVKRLCSHTRDDDISTSAKPVNGPVDRLFDRLGLNRRDPANTPVPRGKPPPFARQAVRHDVQMPSRQELRQASAQTVERIAPPPAPARTESDHARQPDAHHSSEVSPVSPVDRIEGLRPVVAAGREFLRPRRAFERLRSAYEFLTGRDHAAGLEGTEARLTVRLGRAFERELKRGLRVLIFGVGIVGAWATLMPLSGAVVVPGTLVVESDVKKIQHPAGGVVASIPVRDGMQVRAGDLLLHLDETQLRANAQVLSQQLDQIRVRVARLITERDGLDQPQMPHEMANRSGDGDVSRLWASEISLFNSRAATRRNAKELLQSHVGQLGEQISGLDAQVKSKAAQHDLISGELEGVDGLYQKGLVPLTRKTSLQREAARLDGERGQVVAAIAEAKSKISEAELQAVKIDHDFRTEVMKDLREAQDKEAELVEKSTAAQDLLRRVDLRAPTNGIVHQLSVHTIGGVITPGEVVMEIVPESDELQIEAKLPPQEVDHVHHGQRAYIRFSAFNQRTTPQLEGVVSYVSADLNHDRQRNPNAATYYTVRVTLPPSERRRLGGLELVSGMPVEVFLQTGSRTMMSYLLKPISDQLLRTFN
ncbi:MAG TPA: HlyD family type I secretion periplasmic adaptor subunit [Pseudolabrys sp.]|nr:HlyD family type I secretion periplasmic adaptor subunit [Pseudolabrys sp.]